MKYFYVIMLLLSFLLIFGCSVNSNMGSISIINSSDKDALNVKIGNVNMGLVGKGVATTVYFYGNQNEAQINVDDFTPYQSNLKGIIDLKTNSMYYFNLYILNNKYVYYCSGAEQGKDSATTSSIPLK